LAIRSSGDSGFGKGPPTALSEINVTPLVDVMLVLLIIFMVTAPLLQQGVPVNLPEADGATLSATPRQAFLVINQREEIFLDNERVAEVALRDRLDILGNTRPNASLYVQADASLPYGTVVRILAEIQKSRITKVGLVTEAPEPTHPR
jgi:biopolymer transport protein TolR